MTHEPEIHAPRTEAVVVVAVFTPRPGSRDDLVAALRETMPAVHAEPGCELYAIHDAEDGTVTMIEKWATRADLDAHAAGAAVTTLREATLPHLAGANTVTVMTPIPAGVASSGML